MKILFDSLQCPFCPETFGNHGSLAKHMFAAHGNKRCKHVGWGSGAFRAMRFILGG